MILPKIDDLIKIANVITETIGTTCDTSLLEITIGVDKPTLKKLNEEFYYRNNSFGQPDDTDEIVVKIGDITFKYYVKEEI